MHHPFIIRTENLSPDDDSFPICVHLPQKSWFKTAVKNLLFLLLPAVLFFSNGIGQTFPSASSCTSKDLTLVSATLPGMDICNTCTPGDSVKRTLQLAIFNKTGSTRTSFAFWGTLEIRNNDGSFSSSTSITGCGGPVARNTTTTLSFSKVGYVCGQSLTIKNLFLAWTDASPGSICPLNSALIAPKCGTLDSIRINTGLDASFSVTNATCAIPGAIDMTPLGGKSPYTYAWVASDGGVVPAGQATNQDLTGLAAGTYTVTITDASNCKSTRSATITVSPPVTAAAGDDFTKTCISNASGKQIGVASETGFTYSWSPAAGLSNASVSNPMANPGATTTYTVTKTNTATGCSNTDAVTVTVNNAAATASAGDDFTKTCVANVNGKQIGAAAEAGFTYSWSPTSGLNDANVSNPSANPITTTTYTVTKTNSASGCSNTDAVTVTVNNTAVIASAGDDFTKTCVANASGKQIGEVSAAGFTYSWSPTSGLNNANVSNPTANPSSTTTYTVTKTSSASGCSNTDAVTVTVNTNAPDAPTICVVQPSLCGPTTGSVTILSPLGSEYEYSVNNGVSWQSNPVFSNLAAGSVTGIKVKNINSGCISSAANCDASDCSQTAGRPSTTSSTTSQTQTLTSRINDLKIGQASVKAFPNPFNDKVKFVVTAPESGSGSLEVFNLLGQKVKTVFVGRIQTGANTFEVNLPTVKSAQLVYILRMGDKQVSGKLLQLNH